MKQSLEIQKIASLIYLIRGEKVMLDSDLAKLYHVSTKRLNEQVKRNLLRFPKDFMFQLNTSEVESLRSQIATSSLMHGGRRYLPYVFTEQGVAMLSSVLNSSQAIEVNIVIIRTFVKLREILSSHKAVAHKLEVLEKKIGEHDEAIRDIITAIRQLMAPPPAKSKPKIGFHP